MKNRERVLDQCPRRGGKTQIMVDHSVDHLVKRALTGRVATLAIYTQNEDIVLDIMLKSERMGLALEFYRLGGGWIIEGTRPISKEDDDAGHG